MKRILCVALSLGLLLSLACCSVGKGEQKTAADETKPSQEESTSDQTQLEVTQVAQPETEQPTQTEASKTWYLTQNTSDVVASVELPASTQGDQMQQLVTIVVCDYLDRNFPGTFLLVADDTGVSVETADAEHYLEITCTQTYESDGFASFLFEGYYNYKSAANPTNVVFTLNVDTVSNVRVVVKPGQVIDEEFYNAFLPYAQSALDAYVGGAGIASVEDICVKDSLISGLKYTNSGFYAYYTTGGMVVIYPTPGALGDYQKVEIPYSAI